MTLTPATIKAQVMAAINTTIDEHGPVLVARGGGNVYVVLGAMLDMYAVVLGAVCSITRYQHNDRAMAEAEVQLPLLAGGLLLSALRERYAQTRHIEINLLLDAFFLLVTRSGAERRTAPPPLTATLSQWIEETAVGILRSAHPSGSLAGSLTVEQVNLILGAHPVFDRETTILNRKAQLREVKKRVAAAGYKFDVGRLCERLAPYTKRGGLSRSTFNSRWLGYCKEGQDLELWSDSSDIGLRLLLELGRPSDTWTDA